MTGSGIRLRRKLLCALLAGLAATRIHGAAPRPARVIWFSLDSLPPQGEQKRIRDAFAARGRVEGRDLSLEFVALSDETLRAAVAARPDAVVMMGNHLLPEMRRLTRDIPIVFYNLSLDPVALGVVDSLRRPGGNFTGAVIQWDEIYTRYWQLLKEMRPPMKRGGVLIPKEDMTDALLEPLEIRRRALRSAAEGLRIEIREIVVPASASASSIASAVREAGVEALQVEFPASPELRAFVRSTRIPTIGFSFGGVRRGRHLLGISFDWLEGENHAIDTTVRILRGERPATIPVYRTRSYGLAVNLGLARSAGIQVPQSILIQAAEVIE